MVYHLMFQHLIEEIEDAMNFYIIFLYHLAQAVVACQKRTI